MRILIFVLTLLFCEFSLQVNSQNLVVNPSFEDTVLCATVQGTPQRQCAPWFNATNGSPDYWNQTFGSFTNCTGPYGSTGYQLPKTGNAYCGLSLSDNSGQPFDFREYLEGFLNDTLEAKHTYCVSFYVNLANVSELATNSIGAYFSVDSIADYNNASLLPYIPQVQNTGGVITDTLNWVLVSGSFEAQGGEKFITIGNFYADSNTTVVPVNGGWEPAAYYYIDDVSVVDCTVGMEELNKVYGIKVYPNPATHTVTIDLNGAKADDVEFVLFNTLNKKVLEKTLNHVNGTTQINLKGLIDGMYYYTITANNLKTFNGKFTIISK